MPYSDQETQCLAQQEHYIRNKVKFYNRVAARRASRKVWWQAILSELHCICCQETANECLDMHHIDPSNKLQTVSKLNNELRAISKIIAEIEKCICTCANCHRKIHYGSIARLFTSADLIEVPEHLRTWGLYERYQRGGI